MNTEQKSKDTAMNGETNFAFEKAVQEVESIIKQLTDDQNTLDQSLEAYERGVLLIEQCLAYLDKVRTKMEELTIPPVTNTSML